MSIDREDSDERQRQARLDWMTDEFSMARTRRLMKATIDATVVDAASSSETRNLPRMDHDSR
jgi:hypothetical protein